MGLTLCLEFNEDCYQWRVQDAGLKDWVTRTEIERIKRHQERT